MNYSVLYEKSNEISDHCKKENNQTAGESAKKHHK